MKSFQKLWSKLEVKTTKTEDSVEFVDVGRLRAQ
jgi:hypothetical protein